MYSHFHQKRSNDMFECGRTLRFGLFEHIENKTQDKRLENMYTCKDRFCPFCNWRRARKLAIQSYELLQAIQKKRIFVTFS